MIRSRITKQVVRAIVVANAAILVVFAGIYWALGMERHFGTSPGSGAGDALYFATIAHTSVGFGDITPKTRLAKALVSLHVLAVWAVTLALAVDGIACAR